MLNTDYHRIEEIDTEDAHQRFDDGRCRFGVASKGGGGDKKRRPIPLKTNFVPIRTTPDLP
jgi:hypothetical protein